MNKDVFYFLIHPFNNTNKIQVIDLSYSNKYERDEFYTVNSEDFIDQDDAINYAKLLAKKYNLIYEPFTPRYHCSIAEEKEQLNLT